MFPPYLAAFYPVDTRRSMISEPQRKTYRPWEPQRYRQEAQSPDAKLPEGDVVFFLLDMVSKLDLRRSIRRMRMKPGGSPFDPAMMVCLCCMPTAWGYFRAARLRGCERNLAFVATVGADRPDSVPSATS